MRWPLLLVLAAAPLLAEEPAPELDLWLERWQGGVKLGWERRMVERAGQGGLRVTREAWYPIEGGEVRERSVADVDARGLIRAQELVRSGPAGEWRATLSAVGTATTWVVRARGLPPVGGAVPGRVFEPDLLAWRVGTGRQPRPAPGQLARLFDPVTREVAATEVQVTDAASEGEAARVVVRLGHATWSFGAGGALLHVALAAGPGLELVPAPDGATAADMGRTREWTARDGLGPDGLRDEGQGLRLERPGPGWELLRSPRPDGGRLLGARHPDELTVVVEEVPLVPPPDAEARLRVGRAITTLVAAGDGPFQLTHPRAVDWDDRPALEFVVSGRPGGADLRGKAWAVGGARSGLLVIAWVPADQAARLAARIDGARKVVALDPVARPTGWKRVDLPGVEASVEVPESWRPASDQDPSLVAPGALLRFTALRVPPDDTTPRDAALDLVVKRTREQLGAKAVVDDHEARLGGRPCRRAVLEGFSSATDGGLATRVEFGLVPEEDGGFTMLMGVAVESPEGGALLERVMSSIQWRR